MYAKYNKREKCERTQIFKKKKHHSVFIPNEKLLSASSWLVEINVIGFFHLHAVI